VLLPVLLAVLVLQPAVRAAAAWVSGMPAAPGSETPAVLGSGTPEAQVQSRAARRGWALQAGC
jgi:hypothetical protein